MSIYQHQDRIYNNIKELEKIDKIVEKLKTSEYYSSVCNKNIRTVDEYLKNLGINNDILRNYFTNSALRCNFRGYDIEYVDIKKIILEYNTNLYSQLYEPYYQIISDIKDSIGILLKLHENMQPNKEEINLIQKSKYPNLEKRIDKVEELKSNLTPNIKLLRYFDIENLLRNISIKVICYIEACSITKEGQTEYQINNMINYLKNHVIYTKSVEENCKVILEDYKDVKRIEFIKEEQEIKEKQIEETNKLMEMEDQIQMLRKLELQKELSDNFNKEEKKNKKIFIMITGGVLLLIFIIIIILLFKKVY
jgi:hypothetical protein